MSTEMAGRQRRINSERETRGEGMLVSVAQAQVVLPIWINVIPSSPQTRTPNYGMFV